jgi:hypothetical protein
MAKEEKKQEANEKKLQGKELVAEALRQAINFYRAVEKATLQEGNKKISKVIGFTKIALKELEKLG